MKDKLTLRADCSGCLSVHCDAAFVLHNDFRSHTGSTFLMGNGAITILSRKQGMNTRSLTEAEVVHLPNDMEKIISQGTRISSQGEYSLSGQQKWHVA